MTYFCELPVSTATPQYIALATCIRKANREKTLDDKKLSFLSDLAKFPALEGIQTHGMTSLMILAASTDEEFMSVMTGFSITDLGQSVSSVSQEEKVAAARGAGASIFVVPESKEDGDISDSESKGSLSSASAAAPQLKK